MREFHTTIVEIEPVGAQAGGDVDFQLVMGTPLQLRKDTQRGMENVGAVRRLLRQLGFFAGETCCIEDLSEDATTEDSADTDGEYERVTDREAMNVLAGVCRTVLERFQRMQGAANKANGAPAEFLLEFVKLGEKKGIAEGTLGQVEGQLVRTIARNKQLQGAATSLRDKNTTLSTQVAAAETNVERLQSENSGLSAEIGRQRIVMALLLGGLVGSLGLGTAFACHQYGVLDRVFPSHEAQNE